MSSRDVAAADERAARARQRAAGELRAIKSALRSETGLKIKARFWSVAIAGLAVGMEAARRLAGRSGGPAQETVDSGSNLSR